MIGYTAILSRVGIVCDHFPAAAVTEQGGCVTDPMTRKAQSACCLTRKRESSLATLEVLEEDNECRNLVGSSPNYSLSSVGTPGGVAMVWGVRWPLSSILHLP